MGHKKLSLDELMDGELFNWPSRRFRMKLAKTGQPVWTALTHTGHSQTWHLRLYSDSTRKKSVGSAFVKDLFEPDGEGALYTAQRNPSILLERQICAIRKIGDIAKRHAPTLYGYTKRANAQDRYVFVTNWISGQSTRNLLIKAQGREPIKLQRVYEAVKTIAGFDGALERNKKLFNGADSPTVSEVVSQLVEIVRFRHQDEDWIHHPDVAEEIQRKYHLPNSLLTEVSKILSAQRSTSTSSHLYKRHRDMRAHHITGSHIQDYEEIGDGTYFCDVASFLSAEGGIALPEYTEFPRLAAWFTVHERASQDDSTDGVAELTPSEAVELIPESEQYRGAVEIHAELLLQHIHIDAHNKRHDAGRREHLRKGIPNWSEEDMLHARQSAINAQLNYIGERELYLDASIPDAARSAFGGWAELLTRLEYIDLPERVMGNLGR
jgi:hypothetical protein